MAQAYSYNISGQRRTSSIRSVAFFDADYQEPNEAPIDLFEKKKISNLRLLGSALYDQSSQSFLPLAQQASTEWQQLSNLVILGFVSAVESYCRCIIRRLLILDKESQKSSYKHQVTYGAAVFHNENLLPEALLEGASFHNPINIKNGLKEFLGIQVLTQHDSELKDAFENYNIVGHLRHCVVHRAGLLGSKNAIELGIDEHNVFLEKPIDVDLPAIQEIGFTCDNLIKLLNDRLFSKVLYRTAKNINWTGDLRKDKKYFKPYFSLFCPQSRFSNEELKTSYHSFMASIDS